MTKRAVAVDLDGTLLNNQRVVSARNAEALLKAAERGWTIILATARPLRTTRMIVPDAFYPFYWALCNGAWLLKDGEILHRSEIPHDEMHRMVGLFTREGWPFQVEAEDRMFTDSSVPDGFLGEYYPLSELGQHDACKLIVNVASAQEADAVLETIPEEYIGIVTDGGRLIQISHVQCHKVAAVQRVLEWENISLNDTIAFGDDNNDLSLIKAAGVGVAMGNATPEVKAAADHVALTNDEDGVAEFLEKAIRTQP